MRQILLPRNPRAACQPPNMSLMSDPSAAATQESGAHPADGAAPDDAVCTQLLEGVSRTFALTIPQLPAVLAPVVANAYLLCRIQDTIEDEPTLDVASKRLLCAHFAAVLGGQSDPISLRDALLPRLSDRTSPAERKLAQELPRVIGQLRRFSALQQQAITLCVTRMGEGMAEFQQHASASGLEDQAAMDRYCYFVAGVVGEMLTVLFCDYSAGIARNKELLMRLSVSFGQGLQMTNILKDLWEDLGRGACWLPRTVFTGHGFDLDQLRGAQHDPAFQRGLLQLLALAHGHLSNALRYTLLIPARETGIRNFCLWAILMALLTLRRIQARPQFESAAEVKISRSAVRAVIASSRLSARFDALTELLFQYASRGLPAPRLT